MDTYKAYQSFKAGLNSRYSIKRADGTTAPFDFDSMEEADNYIKDRLKKGQNPLTSEVDENKMIQYLLNN